MDMDEGIHVTCLQIMQGPPEDVDTNFGSLN